MSWNIISISREFGSGGMAIGQTVAEKLGIPCYDLKLIEKIAEESGLVKSYVETHSENISGGWMGFSAGRDFYGHSLQDDLNKAQTKVILDVAEKGPCVIIGRCADAILSERKDLLRVFIHAPIETRAERIVKVYGETGDDPVRILKNKDKQRRAYYEFYTENKWGRMSNYHLALDSGALGLDTCAGIIVNLVKMSREDAAKGETE